jgi:hypothetical protein
MTTGHRAREGNRTNLEGGDGRWATGPGSDQLTFEGVSAVVGLPVKTLRTYGARKTLPAPDGYLGRTPWWYRSTIEQWARERPLRGQRGRGRPKPAGEAKS